MKTCLVYYKLPSSGIVWHFIETNLIVTFPAIFREDIHLTLFKVFSKVFIKVLQVVFTEYALRIGTKMVTHLSDLQKLWTCIRWFALHTVPYTFGRYPRSFFAWRFRSRCLSSSTICLRSASLSSSIAFSWASTSWKRCDYQSRSFRTDITFKHYTPEFLDAPPLSCWDAFTNASLSLSL